jgi:hypothetical protein
MRIPFGLTLAVAGAVTLTACGGGESPTTPAPITQNNCFAVVGNKGTVTASITGLIPFTGIVPTGGSSYIPGVGGALGGPRFGFGGLSVQDGTEVDIVAQAAVGIQPVGPNTINTPSTGNRIAVITRSCEAGTGNWIADIAFGSGTITVTSVSPTGASGSFAATLLPGPTSSGQKTISGQFNVTF